MTLSPNINDRQFQSFTKTIDGNVARRVVGGYDGASATLDAFGRLRTSQPQELFQAKFLYGIEDMLYDSLTSGTAAQTYLPNESSVELSVGTADGDRSVLQTHRYFQYNSGKSQLVVCTGVINDSKANKYARIGLFDDSNGIFFESNETLAVVVRSKVTGVVVDNRIEQSSWNIDRLDGNGPSGITLNPTKALIFIFDYQWLGVGKVRIGFVIGPNVIYVHEFDHSNIVSAVYMSTPVLPVRYELLNIGATTSPSTMKAICASVSSEGGQTSAGVGYVAGHSMSALRAVGTTEVPVMAIRMRPTVNSKANRKFASIISVDLYTDAADTKFIVRHMHDITAVTGTWLTTDALSGIEYSTDISAITADESHPVKIKYVSATRAAAGGGSTQLGIINEHSYISRNLANDNSQYFVIYAQAVASTDVATSIEWLESE